MLQADVESLYPWRTRDREHPYGTSNDRGASHRDDNRAHGCSFRLVAAPTYSVRRRHTRNLSEGGSAGDVERVTSSGSWQRREIDPCH